MNYMCISAAECVVVRLMMCKLPFLAARSIASVGWQLADATNSSDK